YTNFLSLESLTEIEQLELAQIRNDFREYLSVERVSEGLVQALTTFPLMRLAGFYRRPIKMSLEQDIANITIEDEDTTITGRFDILAINKEKQIAADIPFWILVVE
ncbi:restriction endonuclease subunit R, partial [Microcoleus sp. HI-ES]|nr:restriction endonuclease subunit R [Microcoleus sp. HI-ES]